MKILCSSAILNLQGQPMTTTDGAPATFASIASEVLLSAPQDPEDVGGEKGYNDYKLAKKLLSSKSVTLKKSEILQIRSLLASSRSFNKLVLGRMFDILEGNLKDADLEA